MAEHVRIKHRLGLPPLLTLHMRSSLASPHPARSNPCLHQTPQVDVVRINNGQRYDVAICRTDGKLNPECARQRRLAVQGHSRWACSAAASSFAMRALLNRIGR